MLKKDIINFIKIHDVYVPGDTVLKSGVKSKHIYKIGVMNKLIIAAFLFSLTAVTHAQSYRGYNYPPADYRGGHEYHRNYNSYRNYPRPSYRYHPPRAYNRLWWFDQGRYDRSDWNCSLGSYRGWTCGFSFGGSWLR